MDSGFRRNDESKKTPCFLSFHNDSLAVHKGCIPAKAGILGGSKKTDNLVGKASGQEEQTDA